MLCYKDKTFCPFYKHCNHGEGCNYALNDDVINKANQNNLPISQFCYPPTSCFSEKEDNPIKWVDGKAKIS